MELTLRAARVNAGMTQQQVFEKTGFARSTLARWEKGETLPRLNDLAVLCELYGIPMECIKWK